MSARYPLRVHSPPHLPAVALCALILLQIADFGDLKTPAPIVGEHMARVGKLEEHACAKCHADVAEEWAGSLHALAWLSEPYREEVAEKKKPQGCWGCHVPQPMQGTDLSQKPEPRADGPASPRHFGISCESCHNDAAGTVYGPWGLPTDAHASKVSASFLPAGRDALCATCHRTNIGPVIGIAKDFELSDQVQKGKSCVACHMAPVQRTLSSTKEARPGRSHALQTPRDPTFLRRAFALSLRVENGKSIVSVANQSAHRVPGLMGRSVEFHAEVLDAAGKVLGKGELQLDTRAFLPVDATLEIPIEATGAAVHVVGDHVDPRLDKPVRFLDERIAPR